MITDLLLRLGELRGRVAVRCEAAGNSPSWADTLRRVDEIIKDVKDEMNKQRGGPGNE